MLNQSKAMLNQSKSVPQVAALPYVALADAFEVLLITSRERGRWLLPKGWPINDRSFADTAQQEAEEEAGVSGVVHQESIGSYTDTKHMREGYAVPCTVFVYPVQVTYQKMDWKEKGQRKCRWYGLSDASRHADVEGLSKLLAEIAGDDGRLLRSAMSVGVEHVHDSSDGSERHSFR